MRTKSKVCRRDQLRPIEHIDLSPPLRQNGVENGPLAGDSGLGNPNDQGESHQSFSLLENRVKLDFDDETILKQTVSWIERNAKSRTDGAENGRNGEKKIVLGYSKEELEKEIDRVRSELLKRLESDSENQAREREQWLLQREDLLLRVSLLEKEKKELKVLCHESSFRMGSGNANADEQPQVDGQGLSKEGVQLSVQVPNSHQVEDWEKTRQVLNQKTVLLEKENLSLKMELKQTELRTGELVSENNKFKETLREMRIYIVEKDNLVSEYENRLKKLEEARRKESTAVEQNKQNVASLKFEFENRENELRNELTRMEESMKLEAEKREFLEKQLKIKEQEITEAREIVESKSSLEEKLAQKDKELKALSDEIQSNELMRVKSEKALGELKIKESKLAAELKEIKDIVTENEQRERKYTERIKKLEERLNKRNETQGLKEKKNPESEQISVQKGREMKEWIKEVQEKSEPNIMEMKPRLNQEVATKDGASMIQLKKKENDILKQNTKTKDATSSADFRTNIDQAPKESNAWHRKESEKQEFKNMAKLIKMGEIYTRKNSTDIDHEHSQEKRNRGESFRQKKKARTEQDKIDKTHENWDAGKRNGNQGANHLQDSGSRKSTSSWDGNRDEEVGNRGAMEDEGKSDHRIDPNCGKMKSRDKRNTRERNNETDVGKRFASNQKNDSHVERDKTKKEYRENHKSKRKKRSNCDSDETFDSEESSSTDNSSSSLETSDSLGDHYKEDTSEDSSEGDVDGHKGFKYRRNTKKNEGINKKSPNHLKNSLDSRSKKQTNDFSHDNWEKNENNTKKSKRYFE